MEFDWITTELLYSTNRPIKIIDGDKARKYPKNDTLHVFLFRPHRNMFEKLKEDGFVNQGAFHMGDETYNIDVSFYSSATYVFRNYFNSKYEQEFPNAHHVPLGTKSGFGRLPENSWLPPSQRKYAVNFIGSLRSHRSEMIEKIKKLNITSFFSYDKPWAAKNGIHIIDYRNIIRESVFTLAPWGNNPESLRLYEAMEAGSIPIFIKLAEEHSPLTPMGPNNPIPQFESWDSAIDFIDKMKTNFDDLEKLQRNVIRFYQTYKKRVQFEIKRIIDDAFYISHGFYC